MTNRHRRRHSGHILLHTVSASCAVFVLCWRFASTVPRCECASVERGRGRPHCKGLTLVHLDHRCSDAAASAPCSCICCGRSAQSASCRHAALDAIRMRPFNRGDSHPPVSTIPSIAVRATHDSGSTPKPVSSTPAPEPSRRAEQACGLSNRQPAERSCGACAACSCPASAAATAPSLASSTAACSLAPPPLQTAPRARPAPAQPCRRLRPLLQTTMVTGTASTTTIAALVCVELCGLSMMGGSASLGCVLLVLLRRCGTRWQLPGSAWRIHAPGTLYVLWLSASSARARSAAPGP